MNSSTFFLQLYFYLIQREQSILKVDSIYIYKTHKQVTLHAKRKEYLKQYYSTVD